ncbi:hypothetical protein BFW38_07635 [Terasakiispira papahanaumokuakeensis]|uniref:HIT domain-containing protein n=1 Tax=Terasakiispira papahanaumokuakeensis TaxID=197479 RepID=A0A1E2VE86_9GAMM|nr:HIT family protein [Terasakiispira papahanaumokuakeensis]ODC05273.1 hypothetical protein BFW38_07635 [Terasakiispira papahanaumokuakeensis]
MTFTLHPRLAADSHWVGELSLCQVRLINDQRFPWLLLIPQRAHMTELHQLDSDDYIQLFTEIRQLAAPFQQLTQADKLNIATLGNMVPQLHLHLVARHPQDAAWPGPVWGHGQAEPYSDEDLTAQINLIRRQLPGLS